MSKEQMNDEAFLTDEQMSKEQMNDEVKKSNKIKKYFPSFAQQRRGAQAA